MDPLESLNQPPSATVAAMVGSQYYWIFHYHPLSLLGHIAVMEGYPPTVELVDALIAKTGCPREAFRTLQRHAHLDKQHRDDLNEVLDNLSLTEAYRKLLGMSALHTVYLATCVLQEIIEPYPTGTSELQ